MRRMQLSEIHDHPRFPSRLRDLVTDALEALWQFGNSYKPILGRLHAVLAANGDAPVSVLDLCSGGCGPWISLAQQLEEEYECPVQVCLSDKYPSKEAIDRTNRAVGPSLTNAKVPAQPQGAKIEFVLTPVDALDIPAQLPGFRTMFSAFHHFDPAEARKILADAAVSHRGVGVFEVAQRGVKTMLVLCFTPLLVLLLTPAMRPFRWSRLFWTYLIPVVPFVIWYDGWMSCLRAYSLGELQEIISGIESEHAGLAYRWEVGTATSGLLPVTYVLGSPVAEAVKTTKQAEAAA